MASLALSYANAADLSGLAVQHQAANSMGIAGNVYSSDARPRIELKKSAVVIESDGSYTPKREKIVDVLGAFESSIGAAVNLELVFAPNSNVLTAEGKETLGLIADVIKYQDSNVAVDIEMPKKIKNGMDYAQRRGDEVIRLLRSQYGVKNPLRFFVTQTGVTPKYHSLKGKKNRSDVQRITILNMGRSS